MSFFSTLLEAFFANKVIDTVDDYRSQKRLEQEQQRKDDLFWQDAVRRENSDEI